MKSQEVLDGVFAELTSGAAKKINFPKKVPVEIAHYGSDFHGYQRAWMLYSSASYVPVRDRTFLIARGESRGEFPAEETYGDITAFPINGSQDPEEELHRSEHHINTLLKDTVYGLVFNSYGRFSLDHEDAVGKILLDYTAQKTAVSADYIDANTVGPAVERLVSYRLEIIAPLAQALLGVLQNWKEPTWNEMRRWAIERKIRELTQERDKLL
ncbi:MAG: hypothetical protein M1484_01030 [Patescibacteria group bacterium]|nr:hypothetical protein [Patescibacteria group bacterium]MCL5431663.1 hypothetical protein [Patescibacteria group bacterium]